MVLKNTLSGAILPLKDAKEISSFVHNYPVPEGQKPVAMHLDGARIFDGVIGEGVDIKEYSACFDSISVCLSKGLGAPMGSVILGSRPFVERAKWFKKMLGGGTRQVCESLPCKYKHMKKEGRRYKLIVYSLAWDDGRCWTLSCEQFHPSAKPCSRPDKINS